MENLQAILFCGGKGSRLYPITDFFQKVMVPVGDDGKPLLEIVIDHLSSFGIKDFIALVGYRNNLIRRYFGDGSKKGISIQYVIDSPEYTGTGGALYNIRNKIQKDNLLIYYTDILTNLNLKKFFDFYINSGSKGSIWVDPEWKISQGVVKTDSSDVISVSRIPPQKDYANTGISILHSSVIEHIEELVTKRSRTNIDLSGDLLPKMVHEGELSAYIEHNLWMDIGSVERLSSIDQNTLDKMFGGKRV
jgi:mannose-1-phosphate guanylyltransferase